MLHSWQWDSCKGGLFITRICQQYEVVISAMSHLFTVNSESAVWHNLVRYTLEELVFLYVTYVKYRSARKCRGKTST
jgi:hypothetical protein